MLQDSLEYQEASHKPDDTELEAWVSALRAGDFSHRQQIIKSHMRFAMSIVSSFATPQRADDLVGEALCALTQAVEWCGPHLNEDGELCESRLHDNNITPYIASTIRRFLRDFIENDRAVYMPGRTFRKKAAAGEIDASGKNTDPVLVSVVSVRLLVVADDHTMDSGDDVVHRRSSIPFTTPEAKREEPSMEFIEALTLAVRTEDERKVIDLRKQGYKYREIAEQTGLSQSTVGVLNCSVEKRFDRLYA